MESDEILRKHLLDLLRGGNAHMPLDAAVADFPLERINDLPPNVPYSPWHLLEHIRITQWDILDFVVNPKYVWRKWPDEYWPAKPARASLAQWNETLAKYHADLKSLDDLVSNPATNLTEEIPHAKGYTILREILVVTDHNAYHIGEFAILRQVMGTWPAKREE
jgi:hypothetical protein